MLKQEEARVEGDRKETEAAVRQEMKWTCTRRVAVTREPLKGRIHRTRYLIGSGGGGESRKVGDEESWAERGSRRGIGTGEGNAGLGVEPEVARGQPRKECPSEDH